MEFGKRSIKCGHRHYPCTSARETYTKSDAWKRAIPGFITALERLPGCSVQPREAGLATRSRRYSSDLADEDFEGTVRECAACTRMHTRAAMQLVLKGKLGDPGYMRGAKCALLPATIFSLGDPYTRHLPGGIASLGA